MHIRARPAALLAFAALLLTALPAAAQAPPPIQPGSSIVAAGSYCTVNWIYQGGGRVYAGSAAHCFSGVGQAVSLASTSLGTAIQRIGTVAFIGDADQPGRDYAFVALDAGVLSQVNPALAGHPTIPTGVSTDAQLGDVMQFSGHGIGANLTQQTREQRVGILNYDDGVEHQVLGFVAPGDSGGPVANVSDGGRAFGIVNTLGAGVSTSALTVVHVGEGGANLEFVLADAASRGFSVSLCVVGSPCG